MCIYMYIFYFLFSIWLYSSIINFVNATSYLLHAFPSSAGFYRGTQRPDISFEEISNTWLKPLPSSLSYISRFKVKVSYFLQNHWTKEAKLIRSQYSLKFVVKMSNFEIMLKYKRKYVGYYSEIVNNLTPLTTLYIIETIFDVLFSSY